MSAAIYTDPRTDVVEAAFHLMEVKEEAENMGDDTWIERNVRPLEQEFEEDDCDLDSLLERINNLEYTG